MSNDDERRQVLNYNPERALAGYPELPADLAQFLGEDCPECETAGPQRHLSAVGGCGTCTGHDPRPAAVPVRKFLGIPDSAVLTYDMVLPKWPYDGVPWTPFRNVLPRSPRCYSLPSGNMVHVRPGCRC